MKNVGQGSLARENKFHFFSGKGFLNPLQIILNCHLLIAVPRSLPESFCTASATEVIQTWSEGSSMMGEMFPLKVACNNGLQGHNSKSSSRTGLKYWHRFAVPQGCRSWCCGAPLHGRGFCMPAGSGHIEVFHTALGKMYIFFTIKPPHSFILPKAKVGIYHTCTEENDH